MADFFSTPLPPERPHRASLKELHSSAPDPATVKLDEAETAAPTTEAACKSVNPVVDFGRSALLGAAGILPKVAGIAARGVNKLSGGELAGEAVERADKTNNDIDQCSRVSPAARVGAVSEKLAEGAAIGGAWGVARAGLHSAMQESGASNKIQNALMNRFAPGA